MIKIKYIINLTILTSFVSCASLDELYEKVKTKEVKEINPYDQFRFSLDNHPISDELANIEYLKKFKNLVCKKTNDEECAIKYKEMRNARLKLKYKNADTDGIKEFCIGYPIECENNEFVEKLYIASNNFQVNQIEEKNKKAQKEKEDAETRAALAGVALAISQSQQNEMARQEKIQQQQFFREQVQEQKRTTCTTNVWGNSITTNCF